jgi:starch synthase (maltosyl-transferring)
MKAPFVTVLIENLSPMIMEGNFAIKRIVGEQIDVEATIYKEGHETIRAMLQWRSMGDSRWQERPMLSLGNDRWRASFQALTLGLMEYTIEAWGDPFESWRTEVIKKLEAGITDLALEALEGAVLVRQTATRSSHKSESKKLQQAAQELQEMGDSTAPFSLAKLKTMIEEEELLALMRRWPDRSLSTVYEPFKKIRIDRPSANFAAWYEFFPRSAAGRGDRGSTFRECLPRIDDAQAMGFDVIYFPPIHPIGSTARKGRNNTLVCQPGDPGVPYAIGSSVGGHDAIEPALGTMEDFEWLLQELRKRNMELALDFALNCSPDHPYVKEHPEWFFHRPDGSIKYAENPPKKYEDVYPLNFYNPQWRELWNELRRVLLFWAERGVSIFRIDNPHTKPVAFWEWLITEVHALFPEVIFLSEAFSTPAIMKRLAKIGFTQSYTYFTWRNTREELEDYFTELTQSETREYLRPHLFTNTPDILPFYLQKSGRAGFLIRAVLAATLSSLYGIYSGFELCEDSPLPDREEYADSEKYYFKERDWNAPGDIKAWITRLNQIRKAYPALHTTNNLHFLPSDNRSLICYHKHAPEEKDHLFIVVNLDPHHTQSGMVELPMHLWGMAPDDCYTVEDLLSEECYSWRGSKNYVSLAPGHPAHILRVI